mmetsp:Transcript_17644/g.37783  ORF Transcript_17644/g.37783 Transcript_17644/m.37783 type:complete len:227 (+) Transcript_17644:562-1242(+)
MHPARGSTDLYTCVQRFSGALSKNNCRSFLLNPLLASQSMRLQRLSYAAAVSTFRPPSSIIAATSANCRAPVLFVSNLSKMISHRARNSTGERPLIGFLSATGFASSAVGSGSCVKGDGANDVLSPGAKCGEPPAEVSVFTAEGGVTEDLVETAAFDAEAPAFVGACGSRRDGYDGGSSYSFACSKSKPPTAAFAVPEAAVEEGAIGSLKAALRTGGSSIASGQIS